MNTQKDTPDQNIDQSAGKESTQVEMLEGGIPKQQQARGRRSLRGVSGWAIALGVITSILGVVAILSPIITGAAAGALLGWLFILASIVQAIDIFQHHKNSGSVVIRALLSLLYLGAGIVVAFNPLAGAASLALVVGAFFFIDGVVRVVLSFRLKPATRWGWMLINGILMIILGIFIWSQWPSNAPGILGLWIGIGLLFSGITTFLFGTAALAASIDRLNH